jgi:Xaa-Pro aminopeptidase
MLGDVKQAAASGNKIWADPSKVSFAITTAAIEAAKAAAGGSRGKGSPRKRPRTENGAASSPSAADDAAVAKKLFVEQPSPITAAKAIKNQAELAGMVEAHMRDAVALAKFFSFTESQVAAGKSFTEVEVDEELTKRRAEQEGFIEASFPTIAGEGPNGAIIHYRAQPGTCRTVGKDSLLLLDSGGQYECGTTDITRTMHFGQPSDHQRECFTRVLQGHIALDEAVFPETTPGLALDTLARMHLWRIGLNYRHGTGHGVGAALNVHEGPMSISTRTYITTPLEAGMIVSNEPGYYEDKAFGIRVENLLHIIEANTPFRYGGQSYFGFERLTFVPIQRKMIKLEVLSQPEVDWVDSYHKEVWEKVSPRLQDDQQALQWLKTNTAPLKG